MSHPVHDSDAEKALIGCCLLDDRTFVRASKMVEASDLYMEPHRHIWRAMSTVYERTEEMDTIMICDALSSQDKLDAIGGASQVSALAGEVPSAANWRRYAEVVSRLSRQRRIRAKLKQSATRLKSRIEDPDAEALDLVDDIQSEVSDRGDSDWVDMSDAVTEWSEYRHRRMESEEPASIPTDVDGVDGVLDGGFRPGRTYWVAGLSKMGKTKFITSMIVGAMRQRREALRERYASQYGTRDVTGDDSTESIADFVARQEIACDWYTAEMTVNDMMDRMVSSVTGAPEDLLHDRSNDASMGLHRRVEKARAELSQLDIRWFFDGRPSLRDIELNVRERKQSIGDRPYFVVIDYVQRIDAGHTGQSAEYRNVTDASKTLSGLSKELNFTGLFVSHFNRSGAKSSGMPQPKHLRSSGQIEQDVDHLLIVHRPYWDDDSETRQRFFICWHALSRHSGGGKVCLEADLATNRFSRWDQPVPQKPRGDSGRSNRRF